MEQGAERFFIPAVIILFALLDLFARWLKKRAGKDKPAAGGGTVLAEEGNAELPERGRIEPQLPPVSLPSPGASVPQPTHRPPPVRTPRRRHHARHWLRHPADARRGIVLMAVLGPCRGLEGPPRMA